MLSGDFMGFGANLRGQPQMLGSGNTGSLVPELSVYILLERTEPEHSVSD